MSHFPNVRLEIAGRGPFLARIEMSDFIDEDRGRPILRMARQSAGNPYRVAWLKFCELASEFPEGENFD
jgi:hypothetical protein